MKLRSSRIILSSPSSHVPKRRRVIDNNDWISTLPDDLLKTILSKLSTKESIKTSILSKIWVGLWRWRPDLVLDMKHADGKLCTQHDKDLSILWAKSITKVMNNHQGNLESCTLHHYLYQSEDGTLETWTQSATRVKQTKSLTLFNHICCLRPNGGYSVLNMAPNTFSYESLTSLSLWRFIVTDTHHHGFNNCWNLRTLKLINIITEVNVINGVLEACSSLEKLLLIIKHVEQRGVLKIVNHNLKYLQLSTPEKVDGIEVKASNLDVLDMRNVSCGRDSFILEAPNVLFNRDYWLAGGSSHISCNISHLAQSGDKRTWNEFMVTSPNEVRQSGSLSVSVDVTNPKEIKILRELLLLWSTGLMIELEIVYKNNDADRQPFPNTKFDIDAVCEDAKPFPNDDFRVHTVWFYNFTGLRTNEFLFALSFVRQKTVTTKMMIETYSSLMPVMKLMVLKRNQGLRILVI